MAKRMPRGRSYFPVHIDVGTLAGGVGRQAPSRRMPTESENVDNFLVSVEHSAEKRRGLRPLTRNTPLNRGMLSEIYSGISDEPEKDLWFHWYEASEDQRFLIVVDYSIDPLSYDPILYVYRIKSDGSFVKDVDFVFIPAGEGAYWSDEQLQLRKYLTWGNAYTYNDGTYNGPDTTPRKAEKALRAVAVGSSILILNTVVKAGFDCDRATATSSWQTVDFNGNLVDQHNLAELKYETTVTVDPENVAESWNGWAQYIAGDAAYDRSDAAQAQEDSFGIWKVKESVSGVIGPSEFGLPSRTPSDQISENVIHHEIQTWGLTPGDGNACFTEEKLSGGTPSNKATGSIQFNHNDDDDGWRTARTTDALTPSEWYTLVNDATQAGTYPESSNGFGIALYTNMPGWGYASNGSPPGTWGRWMYIQAVNMGSTIPGGTLIKHHSNNGNNTGYFVNAHGVNTYAGLAQIFVSAINSLMAYTYEAPNLAVSYWGAANNVSEVEYNTHYSASLLSSGTGFEVTCEYYPNQWERDVHEDDAGTPTAEGDRYTEYTLASDYFYPDPDKQYLGQAVQKLSDLKFPPTLSALTARNGAESAISFYYPDSGDSEGAGKVYYLGQPYLGLSEGHYRVVDNVEQPYLEQLRTPDALSVIDKLRMPKQLYFGPDTIGGTTVDGWNIRHVDWDMRTSGSISSNPGPSIFHDDQGEAVQTNITAMSFYRDRLFLASDDKLVSSRLGDWDNFWLFDPNNITVNDPIDLSVSSNSYTPITYLQPYRSFLFLGTSGDTQYELLGSENQISPLTAEISPTSFFGMAENVEPVLMNNNLFFFDKRKLYIYFGEQSDTQQQALELSVNAPNYLPINYASITVSSDKSSIYIIDKDNENHVYIYTNRVSGDEILQNSFYRFVLDEGVSVKAIKALDTDLYLVTEHLTGTKRYLQLTKLPLDNEELDEPRLDYFIKSEIVSGQYDSANDRTNLTLLYSVVDDLDTLIVADGDDIGREYTLTKNTNIPEALPDQTMGYYTTPGNHSYLTGSQPYAGKKYKAEIELSPQFWRNENLKSANGTLNLRFCLVRYHNSGPFDMEITRKKRTAKTVSFNPYVLDDNDILLGTTSYKDYGVFRVPVLGFSEDLDLKIISQNAQPLTVSSLEFVGKFKQKPTLIGG